MSWTFATLKTAIQDYTENDETSFVNNLNNFIQMAEERILKEVQFDVFRKNQTGTMSSGNKYLTKPTDILAVFSLAIKPASGYVELLQKHPTFIDDYNPDDTVTGRQSTTLILTTRPLSLPPRLTLTIRQKCITSTAPIVLRLGQKVAQRGSASTPLLRCFTRVLLRLIPL
jgi:hypothetical protein